MTAGLVMMKWIWLLLHSAPTILPPPPPPPPLLHQRRRLVVHQRQLGHDTLQGRVRQPQQVLGGCQRAVLVLARVQRQHRQPGQVHWRPAGLPVAPRQLRPREEPRDWEAAVQLQPWEAAGVRLRAGLAGLVDE